MKYIKLFESYNRNEDYFELVDILQSVFDDFDISIATSEDFENTDNYPKHKFWLYSAGKTNSTEHKLIHPGKIGDNVIDKMFIYNINESEKSSLYESLKNLENMIFDILGRNLVIDIENYTNYQQDIDCYDFTLTLV